MKTLIARQGNRLLATLLSGLLMAMGTLFSTSALAQDDTTIVGSIHDFRAQGWATNNPNTEICIVCHTPHNAISPQDGPLWNRDMTTSTFTLYTPVVPAVPGSDIDGTNFNQPSGVSKLCLSCHDGTIAIDAFGGQTGTQFMDDINPAANIGDVVAGTGDLRNDHPVAFTFPDTSPTGDPEIYANVSGLVNGLMPLFGVGQDQMECASCHDVHATNTYDQLLRVDNADSALCLTCHIK